MASGENQSQQFWIGWLPRCGGSACWITEDVQRVPVSWRHSGRLQSLVCSRQLCHHGQLLCLDDDACSSAHALSKPGSSDPHCLQPTLPSHLRRISGTLFPIFASGPILHGRSDSTTYVGEGRRVSTPRSCFTTSPESHPDTILLQRKTDRCPAPAPEEIGN